MIKFPSCWRIENMFCRQSWKICGCIFFIIMMSSANTAAHSVNCVLTPSYPQWDPESCGAKEADHCLLSWCFMRPCLANKLGNKKTKAASECFMCVGWYEWMAGRLKVGLILGHVGNPFELYQLTLAFHYLSGGWFNKKMSSYQYRISHCGDKMILRPSYLHNRISYTGKITSLYWIRALVCPFGHKGNMGFYNAY